MSDEEQKILVQTMRCVGCGKMGVVWVNADEWKAFNERGQLIQNAMPTTSAPIREQLMTGMHPECFAAMASEEEDLIPPDDCLVCPSDCRECCKDRTICDCYMHPGDIECE